MKSIQRIYYFLIFICFSVGTYAQKMPSHPRILMKHGEEVVIKQKLLSDTIWNELHGDILCECDRMLVLPALAREKVGMRLLATSREALRRIFFLSYAYRMTGEEKYFKRAEDELVAVSNFQDWNPSHFLDVAEMTLGVAIGYDWLYHKLPIETKNIISQAIMQKGLLPSLDSKYNWYLHAHHNWNQVCNAGITFGALAIYEQDSVLCKEIVERAVNSVKLPMKEYGPDGAYPEGYAYWKYGTTFNVLLINILENVYRTDLGLLEFDGFMHTAAYYEHMTGISGKSFNYADCGNEYGLTPAMFWFAAKTSNPSLLWFERYFLKEKNKENYLANRFLPAALIWGTQVDMEKICAPDELMWIGEGITPVALMRTSWTDPNGIYVGLKGGMANSNHAHMDASSFVLEANGVRWASDFGMQDYESLESHKLQIWKNDQNSERWKVFRYNNYAHNTLTINNKLHEAIGYAPFINSENEEEQMSATINLTDVFKNDLNYSTRKIGIIEKKLILIEDSIKTLSQKEAVVRWTMLTTATVRKVSEKHLILEQDGRLLHLEFESQTPIEIRTWTTQSSTDFDAPNPGTILVGFESTVPADRSAVFKTYMRPDNFICTKSNIIK